MESNMELQSTAGSDNLDVDCLCNNGSESEVVGSDVKHNGSSKFDILEDLDDIMEDINDGLIISRMVSDSVIKGIANAVGQEADEKIKAKELEILSLKKRLQFFHVNGDENKSSLVQELHHEVEAVGLQEMRESVMEQFKRLKEQIGSVDDLQIRNIGIDKTVDNLEMMINMMCKRVDGVCESHWEHKFEEQLESVIMQSYIKRLQEKYEEELRDHNAISCVSQYVVWADKFNEISSLRNDLDSISKLLTSSDSGNLFSHGSFDTEPLSSQLSSQWEDICDANHIKDMNLEKLVNFFNNRISVIKREHESIVQHMTENYISLKGKYLSERRSVLPHSKDIETLKKKVPQVISKLDKVLVEGDKILGCCNNSNTPDSLTNWVDTLLSDKHQLQDSFVDKKSEVKNFNSSLTVSCIEASIMGDVYKCVIGELGDQIKNMKEESELQIIAVQEKYEVLLKSASVISKSANICEISDSYMESLLVQGLSNILFEETFKDAKLKLEILFNDYLTAIDDLVTLEKKAVKTEAEKDHIARELTRERDEFKLALEELNNLRKQTNWQESLMSKTNQELVQTSDNFLKAKDQIAVDKIEITSLNQKLQLAMEEKRAVDDLIKSYTSSIEEKEKEHRKHMESVVVLVDGLSTKLADFDCRVRGDILLHNARLEKSSSQLCSLIKAANVFKGTGLLYKQKLARKCYDLQMAEDEVDLLGDEVETLLGLLEKIYVALDHYSPVLQHYPGVTEILKLIRRECSGESMKPH